MPGKYRQVSFVEADGEMVLLTIPVPEENKKKDPRQRLYPLDYFRPERDPLYDEVLCF